MNEATAGLHALYSVGLNGVSGTASRRSSLLIPSLSNAIVETKLGASGNNVSHKPTEDNDSIASIEDVTLDTSDRARSNESAEATAATMSIAAESLKSALSASAASKSQSSQISSAVTDTSGSNLIVIARAMFAARLYGAAERAGIVGTRDDNKKRSSLKLICQSDAKTTESCDQEPATENSQDSKPLESAVGSLDPSSRHVHMAAQQISLDSDDTERHATLQDTSVHEDNITAIRARMDVLLTEHNDDEQYFARELVSLQHALDRAQHDLAFARAENDALRAGAMRDDAETTRLRDALRVAERRAIALTFDVDRLLREGTRREGRAEELEVELEDAKEEAARARALVEEMRRRLEVLVGMQRLAGVAIEKASERGPGPGYTGSPEDRKMDPMRLGALARLENQKLDSSFAIGSDDSDDETNTMDADAEANVLEEVALDDLSAEIQRELALLPQEPREAVANPLDTQTVDNSEDSIIIVTDMDTNRRSAPLIYSSKAVPIEQPKSNTITTLEESDVKEKFEEPSVQPIPVFHTARPSLPPRVPKAAPIGAPNRLKSKPSLQRMAIANARRVSDQKFNALRKNATIETNKQVVVDKLMESSERTPSKHSRLKPLLLAARFAAAATVASRRRRSDACLTASAEPEAAKIVNEKDSITPPKPLNPSAQEFTPRKGQQHTQDSSDMPSNPSSETTRTGANLKVLGKKDGSQPDISTLVLTPNPNVNANTPRTTRAISVQILSSRAAARERELAQAIRTASGKADTSAEKLDYIANTSMSRRERERARNSRVVSCPARALPVRVRVSTRLPLALFAERDPNDPTSPMRYEFRPILPSFTGMNLGPDANIPSSGAMKSKGRKISSTGTGTARVVSAPTTSLEAAIATPKAKTGAPLPLITRDSTSSYNSRTDSNKANRRSQSGEVLVTAQRRLERKTRKSFNAVGPSSFWRSNSDSSSSSGVGYDPHSSPRNSGSDRNSSSSSPSSKMHSRKTSMKGSTGTSSPGAKGQKTRLAGKGRPTRRGAFNELTNVGGIMSMAGVGTGTAMGTDAADLKEPGRWLSA